ncbi:VOC family protein [Micromonospora sp. NPDC049679]|uniref:VOC family protein n=1 Tax=Micromonospora sp. NPDC049679 TaxID=3155920 RepID=UPI0034101BD3
MGAVATFWTLGCDADDPQRIAAFWALALGYVKESVFDDPANASIVDPDGRGPAIGFLKVPEDKSAKNRMHIDIRVAGPGPWDMAERARLIRQKVPHSARGPWRISWRTRVARQSTEGQARPRRVAELAS